MTYSGHRRLTVVNFAEIAEEGWSFLRDDLADMPLDWSFYSSQPRSFIERVVRRPKLSRITAAWRATTSAKRAEQALIVSHLPLATLWIAICSRLRSMNTKHVAFAFNFTDLPTGLRRGLMRWSFKSVDRFVVFSQAEKRKYADYFGIDPSRIDFLPWTMPAPVASASCVEGKYVCAVGGEGRDYATLIESVRPHPRIKTVIVTRSYNMPSGPLPAHVQLFTELSPPAFWSIVRNAHAVILPLRDEETCCGHITLVGALRFARPIVATRSAGIADYVRDGGNALLVPAQDPAALSTAISRIWDDHDLHARLKEAIVSDDGAAASLSVWADYFRRYAEALLVDRHGPA